MNLYDLISKMITDECDIELSQEKFDSICHKYQISDSELKKYISEISKHKHLKKIDIQDDMKIYHNYRENDVAFVKQFEKLTKHEDVVGVKFCVLIHIPYLPINLKLVQFEKLISVALYALINIPYTIPLIALLLKSIDE